MNKYFHLLDDASVLRRCSSANIQERGNILATEAKERGRETLHSLVESLIDDSDQLRLSPEVITELRSMEDTLRPSSSGTGAFSTAFAAAAAISNPNFQPGAVAQAAVQLAEEQHARIAAAEKKAATDAPYRTGEVRQAMNEAAEKVAADAPYRTGEVRQAMNGAAEKVAAQSAPLVPLPAAPIPIPGSGSTSPTIRTPNSVFLVQGRNDAINSAMTLFLMSLGVHVCDWQEVLDITAKEKEQSNPFILDVVEKGMEMAEVVIVLITPDETAELRKEAAPDAKPHELLPGMQPRPNVLLEAGMALARDRFRTLLVQWGHTRALSDLGGMHMAEIAQDTLSRGRLRDRLRGMNLQIVENQRWQNAGDFKP